VKQAKRGEGRKARKESTAEEGKHGGGRKARRREESVGKERAVKELQRASDDHETTTTTILQSTADYNYEITSKH
jgi:hypothetical protein